MNDHSKNIQGIYEAIIQHTPDLIYAFDLNYRFTYANDALLKMWGRTIDESVGKSLLELGYEPWHAEMHEREIDQVVATKAAIRGEVSFPHATLGKRIYDYIFAPVFNEKGEVIAISGTTRDISEIKHAEANLKASEMRFRTMVEQAPFAISVLRGENYIVEVANEKQLKLWGKRKEEVMNLPIFTAIPEGKGQGFEELLYNVYTSGIPFIANEIPTTLTRNGRKETFYSNFTYEPLFDGGNKLTGIISVVTDVTEQVQSRKIIEESEQNIRSMVLESPIGICVLDANTLISEIVNDSFVEIAGKRYEDIAGKYYWDTFAEARPYYETALSNVITNGESYYANEVEMMLIRHGKEELIYVSFVYAPLKDLEGHVTKVAVWVLDNTLQVKSRRKVEESDKRFRNMVKQAPVGITILRGPKHIVELANDDYLQLVGRKEVEFIGKPLFEVLPEFEESIRELLNNVLKTGIPYHGNEVAIPIHRNDMQGIGYFDFLYYPLKEEDGNISGIIITVTEVTEKVEGRKKTEQNEERLNIVVEASELGTWELNLKTMVPQYSEKYLNIIGGYKGVTELTHTQLLKHLHPEDFQIREEAFQKAMATGTLYYEARLVWQDKSIHWMQAKGKVLFDSNNLPEKMIGTIRDITEEKTHQQQLEESEQRFRNLILQSPVAKAILKGKDHVVEMANEAILKNIWRKKESEVIGKSILEVFPELKNQKYSQLLDEVFLTGKKHTGKESLISLNGNDGVKYYYVDFEYAPVYSSGDIISGIKITAVDVTEKVEARKIVEENEERFRTLAQTLPQLTWVTDAKGNSEFASSRWIDYSGIEPRGESEWNSIVHPDDRVRINTVWMQSLATGNIYTADVRLRRKDGEYRWHSVKGEPVFDKNNKIIKWVGAFTDIHEQKLREERKDEFISIASHEMKTPLTTAKAYLQMLEGLLDEDNAEAKLYAHKASQAVNRLNELIGELLDVSKIRLGKLNYTITTFNFNALIASTLENMQLTSQSHTIIKTGSVKDNVSGDKERLQQVIINLLSNAIKYSPGEKEVFVSVAQEGDSIKVSVKDKGIGIAAENLNKIFEKYHRIEDHAVQFQGLGIGLFISYEIIQRHNGELWAESEPGKGSVFHFSIPISSNI